MWWELRRSGHRGNVNSGCSFWNLRGEQRLCPELNKTHLCYILAKDLPTFCMCPWLILPPLWWIAYSTESKTNPFFSGFCWVFCHPSENKKLIQLTVLEWPKNFEKCLQPRVTNPASQEHVWAVSLSPVHLTFPSTVTTYSTKQCKEAKMWLGA